MLTLARRLFWLAVLGGVGYAVYTAWQRRNEPVPNGPAEWPPFADVPAAPTSPGAALPDLGTDAPSGAPLPDLDTGAPSTAPLPDLGTDAPSGAPLSDLGTGAPSTAPLPDLGTGAPSTAPLPDLGGRPVTDADRRATGPSGAEVHVAEVDDQATWVEPTDGVCPVDFPIKGKANSGIYHVPGGRFYDRTVPDRCYAAEDAAIADGYRRAKA